MGTDSVMFVNNSSSTKSGNNDSAVKNNQIIKARSAVKHAEYILAMQFLNTEGSDEPSYGYNRSSNDYYETILKDLKSELDYLSNPEDPSKFGAINTSEFLKRIKTVTDRSKKLIKDCTLDRFKRSIANKVDIGNNLIKVTYEGKSPNDQFGPNARGNEIIEYDVSIVDNWGKQQCYYTKKIEVAFNATKGREHWSIVESGMWAEEEQMGCAREYDQTADTRKMDIGDAKANAITKSGEFLEYYSGRLASIYNNDPKAIESASSELTSKLLDLNNNRNSIDVAEVKKESNSIISSAKTEIKRLTFNLFLASLKSSAHVGKFTKIADSVSGDVYTMNERGNVVVTVQLHIADNFNNSVCSYEKKLEVAYDPTRSNEHWNVIDRQYKTLNGQDPNCYMNYEDIATHKKGFLDKLFKK